LNEKIKHGPEGVDNISSEYEHQKALFGKKS